MECRLLSEQAEVRDCRMTVEIDMKLGISTLHGVHTRRYTNSIAVLLACVLLISVHFTFDAKFTVECRNVN